MTFVAHAAGRRKRKAIVRPWASSNTRSCISDKHAARSILREGTIYVRSAYIEIQ